MNWNEVKTAMKENRLVILPFALGDMVIPSGPYGKHEKPLPIKAISFYADGKVTVLFHELETIVERQWSEDEAEGYVLAEQN